MAQSLPELNKLNARLAEQGQRVSDAMDILMSNVDALAAAAEKRQWNDISQITSRIKLHGVRCGFNIMAEAAEDLLRTLPTGNESDSLRKVVRLIGAAGRVRRPSEIKSNSR